MAATTATAKLRKRNNRISKRDIEREVQALRTLIHPQINGIVDIIKDDYNFPYIIMEKCNQSLQD